MQAASAIYGGAAISEELIEDLMAEGLSRPKAQELARQSEQGDRETLRLPAADRDVIRLALETIGKWRIAVGPMGDVRPIGIDFAALDVARDWMGIEKSPALLEGITIIERGALKAMSNR